MKKKTLSLVLGLTALTSISVFGDDIATQLACIKSFPSNAAPTPMYFPFGKADPMVVEEKKYVSSGYFIISGSDVQYVNFAPLAKWDEDNSYDVIARMRDPKLNPTRELYTPIVDFSYKGHTYYFQNDGLVTIYGSDKKKLYPFDMKTLKPVQLNDSPEGHDDFPNVAFRESKKVIKNPLQASGIKKEQLAILEGRLNDVIDEQLHSMRYEGRSSVIGENTEDRKKTGMQEFEKLKRLIETPPCSNLKSIQAKKGEIEEDMAVTIAHAVLDPALKESNEELINKLKDDLYVKGMEQAKDLAKQFTGTEKILPAQSGSQNSSSSGDVNTVK